MSSEALANEVIVVGPPEVWRTIVKSVDAQCRVVAFTTLEELDHWRRNLGFEDASIYHGARSGYFVSDDQGPWKDVYERRLAAAKHPARAPLRAAE